MERDRVSRDARRRVGPLWAAWLACAVACSTPAPENRVEEGHAGAPGVSRVLLAPMNVFEPIPKELIPGAKRTYAMVREYLALHDREVVGLRRSEFSALVDAAAAESDADPERLFEVALIAHLERKREFDVLLIPSLSVRPALMERRDVVWDGVRRSMPRGWMEEAAETNAASLAVEVWSASGSRVFEGIGGLDIIFVADFRTGEWVLADDFLEDRGHLREGIGLAFDPYLPCRW